MSRISRVFQSTNWKYAIGEILLIVVGVSIALAASSWYDNRQRTDAETRMLEALHEALETDLASLQDWHDDVSRYLRRLRILAEEINPGQSCSEAAIANLGAVSAFRYIHINTGPYEALKSQGLDLISDQSLRMKIVNWYDSDWPDLMLTMQVGYNFSLHHSTPYMLENFARPGEGQWIPIDNDICGSDPKLHNLVVYRIGSLESFEIPDYALAIASVQDVLAEIKSALGSGD